MSETLAVEFPYRQCSGCRRQYELDEVVWQARWTLPGNGIRQGRYCPHCGGWLEDKSRYEYPRVLSAEDLVTGDAVYYCHDDISDRAPFGGMRFRVTQPVHDCPHYRGEPAITGKTTGQQYCYPLWRFGLDPKDKRFSTYRVS